MILSLKKTHLIIWVLLIIIVAFSLPLIYCSALQIQQIQ